MQNDKNLESVIICGILWFCINGICFATGVVDKLGVSVGMFGIGAKMCITPQIRAEVRYSLDSDLHTFSGRGYYSLLKGTRFVPFVGTELGYTNFDAEGIKGNGSLVSAFIGSEFFMNNQLSVGLDLGYEIVTLSALGFTVSGGEIIFNTAVNYYFSPQNIKKETMVSPAPVQQPIPATVTTPTPVRQSPPQPATTPATPTPAVKESQTETKICPNCEKLIPANSKFCSFCGQAIQQPKSVDTEPKPATKQLTDAEKKELMEFHYNAGVRLYKSADYTAAIEQFNQVLKYNPNHPQSLMLIEKCEQELKKRKK